MARKYDIIERLKAKNERPILRLDEDHQYTMNTSIVNALMVQKKSEELENSDNPQKVLYGIYKMCLGKEAADYINEQDYTMEASYMIINVIMAAFTGKEYEDEEEEKK